MSEIVAAAAIAVAAVLAAYVAVVAAFFAGQRLVAYPWWLDRRSIPPAGMPGEGFAEVEIVSSDGMRLKAYWMPPDDGAPVVVTFHGIRGWHWLQAARFGSGRWRGAGCGVLAPAFRGYHGSQGWPSEAGFLLDAEACIGFVRSAAPRAGLVIHGYSLGTAVATATAARFPCQALVLEAPFTTLPEVGQRWYPFLPVRRFLRDLFPTRRLIRSVKADRVIVLHGTADRHVPFEMGRSVAAAREGAVFVAMEGAGHTGFREAADEALGLLADGLGRPERIAEAG